VLCYAQNSVGQSVKPCLFHIIEASRPEVVKNCVSQNLSADSLFVSCEEGFNGGRVFEVGFEVERGYLSIYLF
jgi:hypothetical protein